MQMERGLGECVDSRPMHERDGSVIPLRVLKDLPFIFQPASRKSHREQYQYQDGYTHREARRVSESEGDGVFVKFSA